jgi:hypothetical protein
MNTSLRLSIAAFRLATFNLSAAALYVSLESTNPTPPYSTWATAATNIQDVVHAAKSGDLGSGDRTDLLAKAVPPVVPCWKGNGDYIMWLESNDTSPWNVRD